MFSTLGLFRTLPCPTTRCLRINCPFSHEAIKQPSSPADELVSLTAGQNATKPSQPVPVAGKRAGSPITDEDSIRPTKFLRIDPDNLPTVKTANSSRLTTASGVSRSTPSTSKEIMPQGPPKLIVNPVNSKVPLNVRQAMLTGLYNAFKDLYHRFHDSRPDIAHRDALLQEEEIHAKTNKTTYRNAVISSIAGLKKRPVPESPEDPSVGSDGTRAQRKLAANFAKKTFVLKKDDIEDLLLNETTMRLYGMPMEVPPTPGGERPHECGAEMKCDRCGQIYIVTEESTSTACQFHWGRPIRSKTGGTKVQIFTCCSAPYPSSPGCQTGAHVFMEKDIEGLHRRHPFSHSSKTTLASQLDIATIDCEGFYTTQGMSVARVSVCDGDGKVVFDELVRPDEGVHIIDFNTRFSGVTSMEGATFDLKGVRRALDALIGPETIIIGHAVENDLMMLRMIHPLIIDTIVLYPSPLGLPYKRSLRVLAQEFLGRSIQTGGETAGHSSAEDALATLDLVKYHVQNRKGKEKQK